MSSDRDRDTKCPDCKGSGYFRRETPHPDATPDVDVVVRWFLNQEPCRKCGGSGVIKPVEHH